MSKYFKIAFINSAALIGLLSCREEFHPLTPPKDLTCQAPSIEQNIIGTWNFNNSIRIGTITFDTNKKIIDPDSLFTNNIDVGGRVTAKVYSFVTLNTSPSESQLFLLVRKIAKKGEEGVYYSIVDNKCDKVRLALGGSRSTGFELTR